MPKNDKKNDLVEYRIGKLTLLQLMALLAVLGIIGFCVMRWLIG